MDSVFISSIQRDFEDVREAAAGAISSYGLHPIMAETSGASAASAQRALLDEVRNSQVFLLLLGPVYGEPGASGFSPTEDEYLEALRLDLPILVLKQNADLEEAQEAFLARVRGNWEEGRLTGSFDSAADVGNAVIRALRTLDGPSRSVTAEEREQAHGRVTELAEGPDTRGYVTSGSKARLAITPLRSTKILGALELDDAERVGRILGLARSTGVVPDEMALKPSVTAEGISFVGKAEGAWEELNFFVGADGSNVCEGAVGGETGHFAGNLVKADALSRLIETGRNFTMAVWDFIDGGHEIRHAAIMVAIPDAEHKLFTEVELGNSMPMPSGSPSTIMAPNPPMEVRREDLQNETVRQTLVAEVKRTFTDLGALYGSGS